MLIKPLISVVLPTYNHGEFIGKAIQSVLSQTYQNFEIIVIDNNSVDETYKVISGFNDDRIKYYLIDNDGIIAKSRNWGIIQSKGEWISFLDSDDIWYYDKLYDFVTLISEGNSSQVFVHNEYLHHLASGKKKIISCGPYTREFYKDMLIYGNRVSTSAVMVNRSFLMKNELLFNESKEFISVEDYDLWLRIANLGGKYFFLEKPLGEYIIHDNNTSSNTLRSIQNLTLVLKYHVYQLQDFEVDKDLLWRRVKVKIDLMEFRYKFENRDYPNLLIDLVTIFSNILNIFSFLMGKLRIYLQ
jgi:glycosyltransferase involved in cell wall biosynthesis